MREMGGLSKSMPITSRVMLFGSLALAGIIPFSGFFSKGEVLSVTFDAGADHPGFYLLYVLGLFTAFLTAFYAFRLWFMTFHGEYRGHEHPQESPRVMTTPLLILAGFALVSGLLAYPMQGFGNLVFFERADAGFPLVGIPGSHYVLEAFSMGVAVLGIALAWSIYATKRIPAERFTATRGRAFVYRMLGRRYWIDDVYDAFGRTVVYGVARGLDWFDRTVIDGVRNAGGRGGMQVAVQSDVFDRKVIDGAVNAVSLETVRTSCGCANARPVRCRATPGSSWWASSSCSSSCSASGSWSDSSEDPDMVGILTLLWIIPFVGSLVAWGIGTSQRAAKFIGLGFSLVEMGLATWLLLAFINPGWAFALGTPTAAAPPTPGPFVPL